MEKTIKLGKTSVKLSNSVEWLLIYREQFDKDVLQDLAAPVNMAAELAFSAVKATGGKQIEKGDIMKVINAIDYEDIRSALFSLASFESVDLIRILWAMAKAANDEIDTPREWAKSLDAFPLDVVIPTIFDMNAQMLFTTKKYNRLRNAVDILKPKTTGSTSTES